MRRVLLSLFCASSLVAIGCDSGKPGGSGVTKQPSSSSSTTTTDHNAGTSTTTTTTSKSSPSATSNLLGPAENTFTLDLPNLAIRVKQGEAENFTIDINKGKNFAEDVTLSFTDLPPGVSIDPASPMIKNSDKEVKLTLKAAGDAAVGDFTVKVKGQPTKGNVAENTLKVTVNKK